MRQETPGGTPTGTDERRYGFRKALEAVKEAVGVLDEADLLCGPAGTRTGLRRVGERWVGSCPLPDHEDKTPSFTVFPDERWWCFGCNRGGDVLDLHQLAHGYAEKWEALVSLAQERGVELPRRSERWHEAWNRKNYYKDRAYLVRGNVLMRRLYRVLVLPFVDLIEDSEDRERELERTWREWSEDPGVWAELAQQLLSPDAAAGDRAAAVAGVAAARLEADAELEERRGQA